MKLTFPPATTTVSENEFRKVFQYVQSLIDSDFFVKLLETNQYHVNVVFAIERPMDNDFFSNRKNLKLLTKQCFSVLVLQASHVSQWMHAFSRFPTLLLANPSSKDHKKDAWIFEPAY